MHSQIGCVELKNFQLKTAQAWLNRGELISDSFAKFFFYFSGFNALFFLWGKIDHVNGGDKKEIQNLLNKFDEPKAAEILSRVSANVEYFSQRDPVQRMEKRTCENPSASDKSEGIKWKTILLDQTKSARDHLVSLGEIIYLVRSNLIHGSRVPIQDSVAIPNCLDSLKILLEESISLTQMKWQEP
jgi:hypothetical protein